MGIILSIFGLVAILVAIWIELCDIENTLNSIINKNDSK